MPFDIKILGAARISQLQHTTVAYGPATIRVGEVILSADKIRISKETGHIAATGNVIVNRGSETYTADEVQISMKDAKSTATNVQGLLGESYRVASKKIAVDPKDTSQAEYCTLSTCVKKRGKKKRLLWEIKAKKVTYDKKNEDISYDRAFLEFYGMPIMFLPYFSHPSPRVKRRSGLLHPHIIYSRNLGLIVIPRYYLSLAENSEIIFKPVIYGKHSIFWAEHNSLFRSANLSINASYQPSISKRHCLKLDIDDKTEFDKVKRKGYRGHLKGHFDMRLNENYNFFTNISTVSDKSYLTIYSFLDKNRTEWLSEKNLEESNIGIEYTNEAQYGILKAITYQNVRLNNDSYKTPTILPYIEHNAYHLSEIVCGEFYSHIIALNVDYKNDKKDNRVYWNGGFLRNFQIPGGHIISVNLDIFANAYKLRKYQSISEEKLNKKESSDLTRVIPNLSVDYSWPLKLSSTTRPIVSIFSPRIVTILSPKFRKKHQDYIEHSALVFDYLEYNESNILRDNTTAKMNQMNTGNRIAYGFDADIYNKGSEVAQIYLFQSHRFDQQKYKIPFETGYSRRTSSILAGGKYTIMEKCLIGTNLTFSGSPSDLLRSKFYFDMYTDNYSISLGAFCGRQFSVDGKKSRFRNLFARGSVVVNNKITLFADTVIGLKGKILKTAVMMRYEDECFSSDFSIERINYRKVDAKPDIRLLLTVRLRGINSK